MSSPAPPLPPLAWLCQRIQKRHLVFACLFLFLLYGSFRQRFVWGVDSFGYFQQGKLYSEGRLYLPLPQDPAGQPALVPLGFSQDPAGRIIPNYPPGFPLLLALGHWLRAPTWVPPLVGVLSCLILFALLRERVGREAALLFTAAWAFMPLTVYGSTMLMSDLAAATVLLGAWLAFRRGRSALAAWLFALCFAVRPTNVLFLLPFLLVLRPDRATGRLVLHLLLPCALYGFYNLFLYGAPWRTGYGNIFSSMSAAVFPSHLAFFATGTLAILSPVVVGLALIGLFPWNREKTFLLLWPVVFMLFYSFWAGGGIDRWWWARFILPGYAALFILAADGYQSTARWLSGPGATRWSRTGALVLALLTLSLPAYYIKYGYIQGDLWLHDKGVASRQLVREVAAFAPKGSLVGSIEHTSSFLLYTDLVPFVANHPQAPDLVARALAEGRRVFLVPEPWSASDPANLAFSRRFAVREVARCHSPWNLLPVYELSAR